VSNGTYNVVVRAARDGGDSAQRAQFTRAFVDWWHERRATHLAYVAESGGRPQRRGVTVTSVWAGRRSLPLYRRLGFGMDDKLLRLTAGREDGGQA
jgi:hypothetical protein